MKLTRLDSPEVIMTARALERALPLCSALLERIPPPLDDVFGERATGDDQIRRRGLQPALLRREQRAQRVPLRHGGKRLSAGRIHTIHRRMDDDAGRRVVQRCPGRIIRSGDASDMLADVSFTREYLGLA